VNAFIASQKTVDLKWALRGRVGARTCPRIPIIGPMIGRYRPEPLLAIDPSDFWECSCRIMVATAERIRGVNWAPTYRNPDGPESVLSGWHEHRWHPIRGTQDHYPIPLLSDPNTFREVLSWAALAWGLDILGMEMLPRTLQGV